MVARARFKSRGGQDFPAPTLGRRPVLTHAGQRRTQASGATHVHLLVEAQPGGPHGRLGPPPFSWSQVVVVVVAVRDRRLCTDFSRAPARTRPSGSPAAWSASNSIGARIPSVECSRCGL